MHNPEVIQKSRKKYLFDNICFDSSWELALYIYAKDHNEDIERCPCAFQYIYNDKIHYYYPDFRYKGNLVEIKGDYMIDDNGNLIDFYNNHQYDEQLTYKQRCMEDNNVILMKYDDVKFAIDYAKHNYDLSKYRNS